MKKIICIAIAVASLLTAVHAQQVLKSPVNYMKKGDTISTAATSYITFKNIGDDLVSLTAISKKQTGTVSGVVYLQATNDTSYTDWDIISDTLSVGNSQTTYKKTWKFNKYLGTNLSYAAVRAVFVWSTGTVVPWVAYCRRNY